MNFTENYLINNGYDYYGNAAEDTLVFFVRDKGVLFAESPSTENNTSSDGSESEPETKDQLEFDDAENSNLATDFDTFKNTVPGADTGDGEWRKPVTNVAQKEEKER